MSDLRTEPLAALIELVIDHRGKTPKKLGGDFTASGVPVLSAKNVKAGTLVGVDEIRFISEDMYSRWMKDELRHGDVLLTSEAPLGETYFLPPDSRFCLGQRLFGLRARRDLLEPRYFYYLLRSRHVQAGLHARATGTTASGIRQSELLKVPIPFVDSLSEQRAIAHVLGTLDDKIELNRQMNETLEEMARAIFKSWFVNFDPVKAKAEGRQPVGMDAETAALFPDSFEDSELGPVPAGWTVAPIGDAVTCVGGATPSTKEPLYWGGDHAFATPKDLAQLAAPVLMETDKHITDAGVRRISSRLLPKGTVLLSSRAPIGYLAITEIPMAINQGFIAMICDGELPNYYCRLWASVNAAVIENQANGTTFLEISKRAFRPIPIVVPSRPVLDRFTRMVEPHHRAVVANLRESRTLSELRDTLLPRLVSGQLRIPDAENMLAEVPV